MTVRKVLKFIARYGDAFIILGLANVAFAGGGGGGFFSFIAPILGAFMGGGEQAAPQAPQMAPPPPTANNGESAEAKDRAQKRAANAKGLLSTNVTGGTLGDAGTAQASTQKPTLLGG